MKLLNMFILFLSVLVFISCRTNSSTEEAVGVHVSDNQYMLLVKVTTLQGKDIVCRFNCSLNTSDKGISVLEDISIRSQRCLYPKYISGSDLAENSYIKSWLDKNFLEVNGRVLQSNITSDQVNEMVRMFNEATDDTSIGEANTVCATAIGAGYNGGLIVDLVQKESGAISGWQKVYYEKVKQQIEDIEKFESYDDSLVSKSSYDNYYIDSKTKKKWIVFTDAARTHNEAHSKCESQSGGYYLPTYFALHIFLKHGGDKLFGNYNYIHTGSYTNLPGFSSNFDILLYLDEGVINYKYQNDKEPYKGYVACVKDN